MDCTDLPLPLHPYFETRSDPAEAVLRADRAHARSERVISQARRNRSFAAQLTQQVWATRAQLRRQCDAQPQTRPRD